MISLCKVITNIITKEFIDRVESLTKNDGIKPLIESKDYKEGTIHEDDEENDDVNASITRL